VLDLGLRRRFPLDVLERLEGHAFTIIVDDANVEVSFCVEHGRFHRVADGTPASLRFRAAAWDYVALAAREADPDTLFFSRRLVVEGDTELALWVKNTLDTIEIPRTRALLRRALRGVQRAGTGG
ncbi:MAG: SCP2 sterol-binding domain-containing protein, partial [Gammaproteobacteria bacterium]|nr:SCP2 sterol-binding domain-containing protein [Gammaproteobacteria bacterium]